MLCKRNTEMLMEHFTSKSMVNIHTDNIPADNIRTLVDDTNKKKNTDNITKHPRE